MRSFLLRILSPRLYSSQVVMIAAVNPGKAMGKRNLQLGSWNRCSYQRNPKKLTLSYEKKIIK